MKNKLQTTSRAAAHSLTPKLHPSTTPRLHHSNAPTLQRPNASTGRYALRRGLGSWELNFKGQSAVLKHEKGIMYVAYLLTHPSNGLHALDLASRINSIGGSQVGMAQITDPTTGRTVLLESHSRIQERSLSLDRAAAMRAVLRTQTELEAMLEDHLVIEPIRRRAEEDLKALYDYEQKHCARVTDSAQRAARTVRMAIKRFHRRLAAAVDANGNPHTVFRRFADHLEKYILVPSARFSCRTGGRNSTGLAGCFTYEPPRGITWV